MRVIIVKSSLQMEERIIHIVLHHIASVHSAVLLRISEREGYEIKTRKPRRLRGGYRRGGHGFYRSLDRIDSSERMQKDLKSIRLKRCGRKSLSARIGEHNYDKTY